MRSGWCRHASSPSLYRSPTGIATAHATGCHRTDGVTDATAKLRGARGSFSSSLPGAGSQQTQRGVEAEDELERDVVSVLPQTQDGLRAQGADCLAFCGPEGGRRQLRTKRADNGRVVSSSWWLCAVMSCPALKGHRATWQESSTERTWDQTARSPIVFRF